MLPAVIGEMPPGVVTVTSTIDPWAPAGTDAVIVESPLTVNVASATPTLTEVAPEKYWPVIVMELTAPPALVTIGEGYNWIRCEPPPARLVAALRNAAATAELPGEL